MSATTLEHVKSLINELTPIEQAEVLEYLSPRLVQAVKGKQNGSGKASERTTPAEFRRLTDKIASEIAAHDDPASETMTQEFLRTRR